MVDKITWQEAKDYQGTDTVVSLTGEVADVVNMPGMITALFIGGSAMSGTGIGISIADPSTLPMALEDYKGKAITELVRSAPTRWEAPKLMPQRLL
jgi:hypothetical protein